jgi:hypothetical protein
MFTLPRIAAPVAVALVSLTLAPVVVAGLQGSGADASAQTHVRAA